MKITKRKIQALILLLLLVTIVLCTINIETSSIIPHKAIIAGIQVG